MKIDYSKIDDSILEVIQDLSIKTKTPPQFFQIQASLVKEASELKAQLDARPGVRLTDEFRILDRRLTALKKAGKIKFERKGWVLV